MGEGYNEAYARVNGLFGGEPERTLVRFADRLDRRRPVLDVGCGQGRNALWLAHRGFDVVALDPSLQATRQVAAAAAERDLAVDVRRGTHHDILLSETPFGGVCVFGLMQILTREDIEGLVEAVDRWTGEGSLLFVTAWTVEDPRFVDIAEQWRRIGESSFVHEDGRVRTFLRGDEILELFPAWNVMHHWEGLGPWHRHGDAPEERHGVVELVARRP